MGLTKGDGQTDGAVRIWNIMGRAQEGILIVDTNREPRYAVTKKEPAWNSLGDESVETSGLGTVLGRSADGGLAGEEAGKEQSVTA